MKRIFTLASLLFSISSFSQIYFDFSTSSPTGAPASLAVDTISTGNTNGTASVRVSSAVSSGYAGASGTFNAGAPTRLNGFSKDTSTYFELSITPADGFFVSLTGMSFGSRSTGTGPKAYSIRTNSDDFTSDVATGQFTAATSAWALYTPVMLKEAKGNFNSTLTVRIYGYGGAGNAGANTSNWRIDDLSVTATALSTLPLSLSSFNASLLDKSVKLNWVSSNETNVKDFTIERSNDGRTYSSIGKVNTLNRNAASYSFSDVNPAEGVNYYRLKITDKNGALKYSTIASINTRGGIKASLFPNPAVDNLTVSHTKATKDATIRIVNIQGQQLKLVKVESGATQTSVLVNELTKGNYVLIYQNGEERSVTKFVK